MVLILVSVWLFPHPPLPWWPKDMPITLSVISRTILQVFGSVFGVCLFVCWCFELSHPQSITSGLTVFGVLPNPVTRYADDVNLNLHGP